MHGSPLSVNHTAEFILEIVMILAATSLFLSVITSIFKFNVTSIMLSLLTFLATAFLAIAFMMVCRFDVGLTALAVLITIIANSAPLIVVIIAIKRIRANQSQKGR